MTFKLIAHRGNYNGKCVLRENTISYIEEGLEMGFDVEVDVWLRNGEFYLGHDFPEHMTDYNYLIRNAGRFWIHCKNVEALCALVKEPIVNCFFHDKDSYTLTSHKYIWAYPGQTLMSNCVCVMPEWNGQTIDQIVNQNAYGVCSDDLRPFIT